MSQVADILEEFDMPDKPKLVKCLAVHNEEDWIDYNLRNCYDEFDIIRVVEGAVQGRPGATSDGHSTDRTIQKIKSFNDSAGKIELYTQDRHFKSLEEQKQTFLDVASEGEWLVITDADEFYKDGEIDRIRDAIKRRPAATEFIPTFLHFYRDFWHVRDYGPEWNLWHQRIIRYQNGLRYHTHPIATDRNGKCTYFSPEYQLRRFMIPGLYVYHYGHAKSIEFHKMKQEFYSGELEKFSLEDGSDASDKFDEKFHEFQNFIENLSEVLNFDGEHPVVMKSHALYTYVEDFYKDKTFRSWLDTSAYSSRLPTIPQWMLFEKRMQEIFNEVRV